MDGTNYYETVPRDALEKVLWMESDRMGFFINTVTQAGLEREIDVVSNEKRQGENCPFGQSYALMLKYFYPEGHPYSWPVIGSIADLRSATVEDVKEFYRTYYGPNNATLVVAGDFNREKTKELIGKYFGEIPAQEKVEKVKPIPVKLEKTRKLVYEDQFTNVAGLDIAFPGVEQYHPDFYPLRMMALLLSYGKGSPFYKVLVEERKLTSYTNVATSAFELAGQISLSAKAFRGGNLNDIYKGMQEAFRRFETEEIKDSDLERLKIMQETMMYNVMMALESKTQALARNNVFGGSPDRSVEELSKYKAVTKKDIMRVYRQYVKGRHFVALSTVPVGAMDLALSGSEPVNVEQDDYVGQKLASDGKAITDDESFEFTPSVIDRSAEPPLMDNKPEMNIPEIWIGQLQNGMKILGMEYTELPVVQFTIILNSGMLCETADKSGVAMLTAAVMNSGTRMKTAEELEAAFGQLGARATIGASAERMQLTGHCLKKNLPQVVQLIKEMLLEPRWDEEAMELAKTRMRESIHQSVTTPKTIARNVFRRMIYGPDNVLSRSVWRSEESIHSIQLEDLKEFYTKHISPSTATFCFVGGYSKEEVMSLLRPLENDWSAKDVKETGLNMTYTAPPAKIYFVDYPGAKQSYILLGAPAMPRISRDYYPAVIVNKMLGASSNSLLFDVLRLKRGYTYGAYSSFDCGKYLNEFRATSSVQAAYTPEAMLLFRECIADYGNQFTAQTLDKTRDAMFRENAAAFEMPDARLDILEAIAAYELPAGFMKTQEQMLRDMTPEQAQECIRKWLNYDRMFYVVVGDAETQLDRVKKADLGEVIVVNKEGVPEK
ncbi:M16 family metallopeptidase [Odoribacter splanchnicus]|uniref:Pitrilysin family protein n=1 Tax=Odoribacter splanchnicus TaxID=28118 RepID=A0AAW6FE04_9BACT|nr:pitrilysin family protein [Odoribacter splanchnicus]MDB9208177.1 pitrilysin family protein [Odoribacter splanchnicus]MDB9215616.1 pitrilysin family protein [Odoribacter splanchnicus]MDB9221769.1 pitrilysin family protein [Odoribacter splanchnicus]